MGWRVPELPQQTISSVRSDNYMILSQYGVESMGVALQNVRKRICNDSNYFFDNCGEDMDESKDQTMTLLYDYFGDVDGNFFEVADTLKAELEKTDPSVFKVVLYAQMVQDCVRYFYNALSNVGDVLVHMPFFTSDELVDAICDAACEINVPSCYKFIRDGVFVDFEHRINRIKSDYNRAQAGK